MHFSERRLILNNLGPEAFGRSPEALPQSPMVPPELEQRYRQTMGQLSAVLQQLERAGIQSQSVMGDMNRSLPSPFGMYPDGVRPFLPILRQTNIISPYLIGSPNNRLPWNFMPRSWRYSQPTFIPAMGMGMAPYGVPPRFRPMVYQAIRYPLPQVPLRLPSPPAVRPLPSWQVEPLNRDPRGSFSPRPRQLLIETLSPPVPRPVTRLNVGASVPTTSPEVELNSAITFNYDGPPQAITIAVNGQMLSLPTLPADGQTIQDPRGFRLSRRGNVYSVVYGRF